MWCPSWLLASENNIEQLITEFPVHASKQLSTDHKNSHTVERLSIAQHLSNAELALARIHVAIVQGAFEQANKQLTEVNQRLLSGNELAYFYYLNALNLVNQFNGVGAMDYLKRLKVADSPSVLVNPQFSYLLVYARIYFNAHELNLFSNTLIQLKSMHDKSPNSWMFCQLTNLRLQSAVDENKVRSIEELQRTITDNCLFDKNGVVAADSYYQLAAADIALKMIRQETAEYLQKSILIYKSQNIVNRLIDTYLLSAELALISKNLSNSTVALKALKTRLSTKITAPQKIKFYRLSAQHYRFSDEIDNALRALEFFVAEKAKLEKNKRIDNVSFLTFRITDNKQHLERLIHQEKETIKRGIQEEKWYCYLFVFFSFLAVSSLIYALYYFVRRGLR